MEVGDRILSMQSWQKLKDAVECWTSPAGNWIDQPDVPPLYTKVFSNDQNLVSKVYSSCGPVENRTGLTYHWVPPSNCSVPLYKFSFASMCKVMRGRNLIFTGDSLSLHHYETTLNALGSRTVYGEEYDDHDPDHWSQPYDCATPGYGKNFSVIYLSWNNIAYRYHFDSIKLLTEDNNGSVLVANWGAFVQGDETVRVHMRDILEYINLHVPNMTFIFRSSNMAHKDCHEHSIPDNILHEPAPHPVHRRFHWDVFPRQGVIWKEYLDTHEMGKIFLDILPLSSKRPDQHPSQHGDCLHYCIPGPIDTWVKLTYSVLQLIEDLVEFDRAHSLLTTESTQVHSTVIHQQSGQSDADLHKVILELENKVHELHKALVEEKRKNKMLLTHLHSSPRPPQE